MDMQLNLGESPSSNDPVSETLRKLASHLDNSAGALLLIEALQLLNSQTSTNNNNNASSTKLGAGTNLISPFVITTEEAPPLS